MSDRTVKVSLVAEVNNYLAGMEKAAKATKELGTDAEKLAQKKEAFDVLGKASISMGIGASAAIALAVAKYAEFDAAMSNVQAATQATAADQERLSAAALEAGASTVFSATESANAIEELSKAGLDTADIMGGALKGSLDLASAGQLGVARAAEISATALQQFNLDGDQAGHVADVLAAGAGKAMGSVDDLAAGLKFVAPVANDLGISLEETTGTLALFAQQGIIGEQAGTGLRAVLSSLTSPSAQAGKEIERLGINLYDANGKFLGMENAAGELSKAYSGMDDASRSASMGIVFGRETITAATSLYKAGATGVDEWTRAVDDSGYAAKVAKDRLDNLKGDVEALGGAFDTALIQTGSAGNDVLREMTQTLTDVIDLYNAAPEPVKGVVLATGGLAAAVGLAGGAFLLGTPKVAAFNAALATMGPTAQKAGTLLTASMGPVGLSVAAAAGVLAIFAGEQAEAKALTDSLTESLDANTGAFTRNTREQVVNALQAMGPLIDSAKSLGLSTKDLTDYVLDEGDAIRDVNKVLNEQRDPLSEAAVSADVVAKAIGGLTDKTKESQKQWHEQKSAMGDATDAAKTNTDALDALQGKASDTGASVDELSDAIRGFGSETLSVRDANRALEDSYDTLEQSLKDNGSTLDITTEAGRANETALDGIARAALEASAATLDQTGSQVDANAVLATGRTRLIEMLGQLGITGQEAEAYADKLGLIPDNVYTAAKVTDVDTAEAILANLARNRTAIIQAQIKQTGADPGQVKAAYNATGGTIRGPGTGTSDSILSWLSNGEEVIRASSAEKYRPLLKAINADAVGDHIKGLALGGTAGGPPEGSFAWMASQIPDDTARGYGAYGAYGHPSYATNNQTTFVNTGPSEVVLSGVTLVVKDAGGGLVGRMQLEADQRISIADQTNSRQLRRGRQ